MDIIAVSEADNSDLANYPKAVEEVKDVEPQGLRETDFLVKFSHYGPGGFTIDSVLVSAQNASDARSKVRRQYEGKNPDIIAVSEASALDETRVQRLEIEKNEEKQAESSFEDLQDDIVNDITTETSHASGNTSMLWLKSIVSESSRSKYEEDEDGFNYQIKFSYFEKGRGFVIDIAIINAANDSQARMKLRRQYAGKSIDIISVSATNGRNTDDAVSEMKNISGHRRGRSADYGNLHGDREIAGSGGSNILNDGNPDNESGYQIKFSYFDKDKGFVTEDANVEAPDAFAARTKLKHEYADKDIEIISVSGITNGSKLSGAKLVGVEYGSFSNGITAAGDFKMHGAQGHGYAAERANTQYDILHGKTAKVLGDDNAKNGADRIVNGRWIQSKYYVNGKGCVDACFDKTTGEWRYFNEDGSVMTIEVPNDEQIYEDAVKRMKQKIREGKVPGVTDEAKAKEIIKRGRYTYVQAKNIAKPGTIESITYDAMNGMITSAYSFGLSAAISFAVSIWNGEDFDDALKKAAYTGLQVGGVTFVSAVLAGQAAKMGLNTAFYPASRFIVQAIGPQASAVLVNIFRTGKDIYGAAAMSSMTKMLNSNLMTAALTVVVLSAFDIKNMFSGRISAAQLFKNVSTTAGSIAGGVAGFAVGSKAGAALGSIGGPIGLGVGYLAGGLLGSIFGGSAAGKATNAAVGVFVEDDAEEMVRIIESVLADMANEYLIGKTEGDKIVSALQGKLTGDKLKDMYASSSRKKFARNLLQPIIDDVIEERKHISQITDEEMTKGLRMALEEVSGAA